MSKEKRGDSAMAQNQRVKVQLKHDAELWKAVLGTYEGRLVIRRILETCGVFNDYGNTDQGGMARFLGKRSVGLLLIGEIHLHSNRAYQQMEQEECERQMKINQSTNASVSMEDNDA